MTSITTSYNVAPVSASSGPSVFAGNAVLDVIYPGAYAATVFQTNQLVNTSTADFQLGGPTNSDLFFKSAGTYIVEVCCGGWDCELTADPGMYFFVYNDSDVFQWVSPRTTATSCNGASVFATVVAPKAGWYVSFIYKGSLALTITTTNQNQFNVKATKVA